MYISIKYLACVALWLPVMYSSQEQVSKFDNQSTVLLHSNKIILLLKKKSDHVAYFDMLTELLISDIVHRKMNIAYNNKVNEELRDFDFSCELFCEQELLSRHVLMLKRYKEWKTIFYSAYDHEIKLHLHAIDKMTLQTPHFKP